MAILGPAFTSLQPISTSVINGLSNGLSNAAYLLSGSSWIDRNRFEDSSNILSPFLDSDNWSALRESINSGHLSSRQNSNGQPVLNQSSSAGSVSRSPVTPAVIDYLNADLAKHYGLGKETAYQEALSNTSYQRAVADMKAAGLNPAAIFGAGKGYTAGGVSYVNDASGSGRSGGSGSSENGYLFDEGMYHAISTAAGLAGLAITKQPIGFYIAQTAAQGVMGAMNHFSK